MLGKKVKKLVRILRRNDFLRSIAIVSGLLFLITSFVILGVTGNVFLHELAHYEVAKHFSLNPQMHISNVIEVRGMEGIRFNMNPVAYTTFSNPHDDFTNLYVTSAGPLMNIMISIVVLGLYLIVRYSISKKITSFLVKDRILLAKRWNNLRFVVDVIFISLLVPSLVASIVNLSSVSGSDGEAIRAILSRM